MRHYKAEKRLNDKQARVRELLKLHEEYGQMEKTCAETLHTLNQSDATSTSTGTGSPQRKVKNPIAAAHSREARVCSPVPWAAMGLARVSASASASVSVSVSA